MTAAWRAHIGGLLQPGGKGFPPSGPSWELRGLHVSGAQRQMQESCRSLPCQSHNPLGDSGFVGGGAGGGNGEGESAVLTSFMAILMWEVCGPHCEDSCFPFLTQLPWASAVVPVTLFRAIKSQGVL